MYNHSSKGKDQFKETIEVQNYHDIHACDECL